MKKVFLGIILIFLANSAFAGWSSSYRQPTLNSINAKVNRNNINILYNKGGVAQNKFHRQKNRDLINKNIFDINSLFEQIGEINTELESFNPNTNQGSKIYSNGIEVGTVQWITPFNQTIVWKPNESFEVVLLYPNGKIYSPSFYYFENENCVGTPYLLVQNKNQKSWLLTTKKYGKIFAIKNDLYFHDPEEIVVYRKEMLSTMYFESCQNIEDPTSDSTALYLKLYLNDSNITGVPHYPLQNITIEGAVPLNIIE